MEGGMPMIPGQEGKPNHNEEIDFIISLQERIPVKEAFLENMKEHYKDNQARLITKIKEKQSSGKYTDRDQKVMTRIEELRKKNQKIAAATKKYAPLNDEFIKALDQQNELKEEFIKNENEILQMEQENYICTKPSLLLDDSYDSIKSREFGTKSQKDDETNAGSDQKEIHLAKIQPRAAESEEGKQVEQQIEDIAHKATKRLQPIYDQVDDMEKHPNYIKIMNLFNTCPEGLHDPKISENWMTHGPFKLKENLEYGNVEFNPNLRIVEFESLGIKYQGQVDAEWNICGLGRITINENKKACQVIEGGRLELINLRPEGKIRIFYDQAKHMNFCHGLIEQTRFKGLGIGIRQQGDSCSGFFVRGRFLPATYFV